jgi:hypothetical protein
VQLVSPPRGIGSSKSEFHPILRYREGLVARRREGSLPEVPTVEITMNKSRKRMCHAVRYADATSVERFASYMALSAR